MKQAPRSLVIRATPARPGHVTAMRDPCLSARFGSWDTGIFKFRTNLLALLFRLSQEWTQRGSPRPRRL